MPLIPPILDNRTYAELRDELVARIPIYTPEWTNHNESDPGIALLELFAYLGESLLYRFNQIPDTTRIEFLKLLGVRPRPARPARVLLTATTDLPKGAQVLRGTVALAGSVAFETEDEVYVWPVDLLGAGKTQETPQDTKADKERSGDALARAGIVDPAAAQFYKTTEVARDPLAAGAVNVDVSAQVDGALWVALLAEPSFDPAELGGRILFVGVAFDETIDVPFALEPLDVDEAEVFRSTGLTSAPPPVVWQMWDGADGTLNELKVVRDTTQGMVTTGVVAIELPARLPPRTAGMTGVGDSPPPLDDAKLAERAFAWMKVSRPEGVDVGDAIGRVRWVGANAVHAVQAQTAAPELIGTGTGDGGQSFPLNHRPVMARTVELQVDEPGGWTTWEEVDSFAASKAGDRHFTVDLDTGMVSFGRNTVPQIGEQIRVRAYRHGGGVIGNVAAKAVSALSGIGGVKVSNPLPAAGGTDRVTLTDAIDTIPAEVHRGDRAVILDDFAAHAKQVSGVSRAEALGLFHPDSPAEVAAGVVSVVIFPDSDLRNPAAPLPDLGLLRRTALHLDERRLVTTELYVIPPEYSKVSLSVGLQVREGFQVDAVRRWVELILRQYLAPLPPYGPDGKGWPLGRAVRRAELEAVAVQVDGVEYLEDMILGAVQPSGVVELGLIPMERWQVPELAEITVVSGPPLPLGSAYAPAPPEKVPVPLPPDEC
jgi:predicted phage baseplate assembly protein